jgi:hypothetical protein
MQPHDLVGPQTQAGQLIEKFMDVSGVVHRKTARPESFSSGPWQFFASDGARICKEIRIWQFVLSLMKVQLAANSFQFGICGERNETAFLIRDVAVQESYNVVLLF